MTELDVLNQMLGTLGEAPLQDADEEHTLLPAAKQRLANTLRQEQSRGWWFNREVATFTPADDTGFIYIPEDIVSLDPVDASLPYVHRGRRLYNTATNTYVFTVPVICTIVRLLDFVDVPMNAQLLIGACAVKAFNLDYDGDATKLREAKEQERNARIELGREEIRNVKANLLQRASTAAVLNRIAGKSGRLRTA